VDLHYRNTRLRSRREFRLSIWGGLISEWDHSRGQLRQTNFTSRPSLFRLLLDAHLHTMDLWIRWTRNVSSKTTDAALVVSFIVIREVRADCAAPAAGDVWPAVPRAA
jgi:hypothetical protein